MSEIESLCRFGNRQFYCFLHLLLYANFKAETPWLLSPFHAKEEKEKILWVFIILSFNNLFLF